MRSCYDCPDAPAFGYGPPAMTDAARLDWIAQQTAQHIERMRLDAWRMAFRAQNLGYDGYYASIEPEIKVELGGRND